MSADTTGISSTGEEDRARVSIPIPAPDAEPASKAAITALAPPPNIPRLVRAARPPRNQQGDTLEGRRPGQEGTGMRAEANDGEAPRQDGRSRSTRLTSRIGQPEAERRRAASEERLRVRQERPGRRDPAGGNRPGDCGGTPSCQSPRTQLGCCGERHSQPPYRGPGAQKHMKRRRDNAVSLIVRSLVRQMEDNADFYMP